jgi:hypothetical protein
LPQRLELIRPLTLCVNYWQKKADRPFSDVPKILISAVLSRDGDENVTAFSFHAASPENLVDGMEHAKLTGNSCCFWMEATDAKASRKDRDSGA